MGVFASSQEYVAAAKETLRVLVLDDDAFDRKRLRRWIERGAAAGTVHLHEAADLSRFAEQIARHRFDIVLLDYALPDGTGLDAVRMLRAEARNAASYAVMISGRCDDALFRSSLLAGCDRYVEKAALDAGQMAGLLKAAGTGSLEVPVSPGVAETPAGRSAARSALAYWTRRAELRAKRARPEERARDLSLLHAALGLPPTPPPGSTLTDEMSQKLRLFILDFLACDTFEFIPGGGETLPGEGDI